MSKSLIKKPKSSTPKNCNVVLVEYDSNVGEVSEVRHKSNLTYSEADKLVKKNELPLYFYVIGSQNTHKPVEIRNEKCQSEYDKVQD